MKRETPTNRLDAELKWDKKHKGISSTINATGGSANNNTRKIGNWILSATLRVSPVNSTFAAVPKSGHHTFSNRQIV
jgi:hypothetical protein